MSRNFKSLNQICFESELEHIRSKSLFDQLSIRPLKSDTSLFSIKCPDVGTRIKLRRLILNLRSI